MSSCCRSAASAGEPANERPTLTRIPRCSSSHAVKTDSFVGVGLITGISRRSARILTVFPENAARIAGGAGRAREPWSSFRLSRGGPAELSGGMASGYTEASIKTLSSTEHIRLRPGMYIGRLGSGAHAEDGIYVLLKETGR